MAYLQLSAVDKKNRISSINTDLSTASFLCIYTGTPPLAPDNTVPGGNLLVAMPCSNPFGAATYFVQNASITAGGTTGTNGAATVTGTTGTGTKFQAAVTIAGNTITSINSISVAGSYTVLPTSMSAEPVTGGALTGATLALQISSMLTASAITTTNATATGTAGFARLAIAATAGAVGIVDLDVATSGASVTINTTSIVSGGPVVVTSAVISEA
jgi:hypothetical protein